MHYGKPRILLFALALVASTASFSLVNHPVLVEGNCPGPASRTIVAPNTCGDFDGDGRIGTAEDVDSPDRVFGTINAALGAGTGAAAGTGANQNGSVTIVASGIFPEIVTITSANGNTQLVAVPGVEADIDAVLQGDATPPGNAGRQNAPGIIVNAPANRHVTIRNIRIRNFATGIDVQGVSHVTIEKGLVENNANWGIRVRDQARVTISQSEVIATGRRVGAGTDFPALNDPMPGVGIEYEDASSGVVSFTAVTGSFRAGIKGSRRQVCVHHLTVFDNNPNFQGVRSGNDDCDGQNEGND